MAGGVSVQFHTDAQHVTGGERGPSPSEFGILPPESYPDADTPGKRRFIENINLWLHEGLQSTRTAATSPHEVDVTRYYGSPVQDDPHMRLEAYHNLIQHLRDVHMRANAQPDRNDPEFAVKSPPVSILYQMGGDIYHLAKQVKDYSVYEEFLNYSVGSMALSGDYPKWALMKQVELSEMLIKDPVLQTAKTNWGELSVHEKMKIAEHVHALQARVYGFKPDQIIDAEKEGTEVFVAGAEQNGGKITLNLSSDVFDRPYEKFVGLVVHEGNHTLQEQMAHRAGQIQLIELDVIKNMGLQRYQDLKTDAQKQEFQKHVRDQIAKSGVSGPWDDRLGFYGDFRPQVMLWHLPYVPGEENEMAYRRHPREVASYMAEGGIIKFLKASPEEQQRSLYLIKGSIDTVTRQSSSPVDSHDGLAWRASAYSFTN